MQQLGTWDAAAALSPAPSCLTCSLRGVSESWAPGSDQILAFPAKKGGKQQDTCATEQLARVLPQAGGSGEMPSGTAMLPPMARHRAYLGRKRG